MLPLMAQPLINLVDVVELPWSLSNSQMLCRAVRLGLEGRGSAHHAAGQLVRGLLEAELSFVCDLAAVEDVVAWIEVVLTQSLDADQVALPHLQSSLLEVGIPSSRSTSHRSRRVASARPLVGILSSLFIADAVQIAEALLRGGQVSSRVLLAVLVPEHVAPQILVEVYLMQPLAILQLLCA